MTAKEVAAKLVKEFEGCHLKAYPDPATGGAPWTNGWGSTGPDVKPGTVWTQAQADARLESDLKKFLDGVSAAVKVPLNANQHGALASFAYNVGLGNLRSSTLLKLLNAGDYKGAQGQFIRWNRANGKVMRGLTRRREKEASVFGEPI